MRTARPRHERPEMEHYENFPVASWLCPAHLRPPISAIYAFARTADDIADEGAAPAPERLADLAAFRRDLYASAAGVPDSGRWPQVFGPLRLALSDFCLPITLLEQLLDAFEQDVRFTAGSLRYETDAELLDYCRRSANPVGRLLLHLYGIDDGLSMAQSDQICSALQLINFWQDLSVDVQRSRWYPSRQTMRRFGVADADLQAASLSGQATRMLTHYVREAREMMRQGAPLACRIKGRAGWELRFVVQGGLRILDKIEALGYRSWLQRPTLAWRDMPLLAWRVWRMN